MLHDDPPSDGTFGAKLCAELLGETGRVLLQEGGLVQIFGFSQVDAMRSLLDDIDWEVIADRCLRDA